MSGGPAAWAGEPVPALEALEASSRDRVEAEIDAHVSSDLSEVRVEVRELYFPAKNLDEIPIVLAADRYRSPGALRPSEVRELFPGELSSGGFEALEIRVDGIECKPRFEPLPGGARLALCGGVVGAGDSIEVRISARLRVPERYGAFGRVGRALTLGAGWYPYVARPEVGPPRGLHRVRIDAPAELSAVVRSRYFPAVATPGEERRRFSSEERDAAQVPLLLRPATARVVSIAGGRARFLTGPGSAVQTRAEPPVLVREVRAALVDALRFLGEEGLGLPASSEPVVVIEAPLRHDLSQAIDGAVLISDHAFRVPDFQRFHRFHRFPLLREVFGVLVARWLRERPATAAELGLTADAIGAWLLDRYIASRFGRAEDAFDVLGIVSFIPSIDSMLYAPDLPFVASYFRVINEDDPLRPDLIAFPAPLPRGKVIHEKLADRLGHLRTERVMKAMLAGAPMGSAIADAFSDAGVARRFLEAWLRPYPSLQYRLASWSSAPAPERCSGCFEARVEIERRGDAASEPIGVRLLDAEGVERIVVATATDAARRTVTATLAAPLDRVELDPFGRLAEAPSEDDPSPRFDNRSSPAWKILLNSFNFVVSATEGQVDTAIDVGIQRRYDPRWGFALRADWAQEAVGFTTRASYAFGPPVTAARLSHALGLAVTGEYLRPGFAGTDTGGPALTVSGSYGFDNRESLWAPESGAAVRLSLAYAHAFASLEGTGLSKDTLSFSLRGLGQWMLGARHQLSLKATVGAYLFGEPREQLRFSLGGRGSVRGYAFDAELGLARGVLSAEWLHPLLPKLELDGFRLAWVTGLDGALFGDLGVIGQDVEEALRGPVFADVGYGLRFYIEYGGVRPGVLAVEVALPLVRARGGVELGPPALYIAVAQSFTGI